MSKSRKKMTYESIGTIALYDLDGTFEHAIKYLNDLYAKFRADHPDGDLTISLEDERWDDGKIYNVYLKREETDEEYKKRLADEQMWKERRRQQYEQLKKEFEGK